ncbi:MAG: diaminopimelate epimerase [Crocinitomicaceae bacterium]|nr:diaminopimelate epimerase [Crocinitomicaceae bacterium]
MQINFWKYQGAGNDFIMVDNREKSIDSSNIEIVRKLCSRKFGIGSDGMIFIEPSDKADFTMNFFNPDGSKSFCGNGSRCAVAFAKFIGIDKDKMTFEAIDGLHYAEIKKDSISIKMHDVEKVNQLEEASFTDTGSPHYMKFCSDVSRVEVKEEGSKIRYSDQYKTEGVNVNFIQVLGENHIKVRTYERGVEDETLACGTGATACALSYLNKGIDGKHLVRVDVGGGTLYIHSEKNGNGFKNIWLQGPAIAVFKGSVDV